LYGWGLWWWEDFAAVSALRRKIITAFVVVCGFLASGFLIGELANSKIGLTDENDLPQYVGTRGQISFADIPRLLVEKTDLGQFGQSQRFRPFYYVARLTETALWGLNGSYWYRWRIVMFGMVIAAMFWLCTQCVGVVLGAIITAYTLSLPMWVDIWTRSTGPSEQYASLGTAIFALGAWFFLERWRSQTTLVAPSIAMAIGAIIAMGAKENMLLLEVPLFAALSAGLWRRRIGWGSVTVLAVALAFGVWIAASIIDYFLGAKVEDIYGHTLRTSLIGAKGMVFVYAATAVTTISILATIALLRRAGDKGRLDRYMKLTRKYLGYAAVILVIFVFNDVFYTGQIPSGIRYDFPALLALPALTILLLHGLGAVANLFDARRTVTGAVGALMSVAMLVFVAGSLPALPAAAAANVARNSVFDDGLREAQRLTHEHPDWPIYIKSFNYFDFEPVQALGFFFMSKGITNPRYLVFVANAHGEPRTPFQTGLEQTLISESVNGSPDRGYSPLYDANSRIGGGGDCFVLILRSAEQFAADKAGGKNPAIANDCAAIPTFLYWEGSTLNFKSQSSTAVR
jgi:hypothetical protein